MAVRLTDRYASESLYHRVKRLTFTSTGRPYYAYDIVMPRIHNDILDCVVYLYPSEDAAQEGRQAGGTGFFVGIPTKVPGGGSHLYVVTNDHVIAPEDGSPPSRVIRVNTGKSFEVIADTDWTQSATDDLAVCHNIPEWVEGVHVGRGDFLTQEIIDKYTIGPGDETFMVGRFATHEGKQRNTPTARFGNVSMMPLEPIKHRRHDMLAFLVEMRSIPGYSGSPVFVHILPATHRQGAPSRSSLVSEYLGPWLLGVDCAHLVDKLTIVDGTTGKAMSSLYARGNSGMAVVTPAWRLAAILDHPTLNQLRHEEEDRIRLGMQNDTVPDSSAD